MGLPEHMRGCEILKMDAASWLQASNERLTMWRPPRCPFLRSTASRFRCFTAQTIASSEVLSGMTRRQRGRRPRGRFGGGRQQLEGEPRGGSWTNAAGFATL